MNELTPLLYQKTCTTLSSGGWWLTCRSWSQSSHWSLLWISSRVRNLPGWFWAVSQWGLPSLGRPVARSPRRSAVWWCSSRCCPEHRSPLRHRRSSALPPPSWVTGKSHTRLTSTKELDFNFSALLMRRFRRNVPNTTFGWIHSFILAVCMFDLYLQLSATTCSYDRRKTSSHVGFSD